MAKRTKALDEDQQTEMDTGTEDSAAQDDVTTGNEVAVRPEQDQQLPANIPDMNAWGAAPISAKDTIMPRILLMQPMSDAVTNGDAKFGEFRESLTNEIIGDFNKGFEVVPFHMRKVWIESDVTNGTDMKNKKFLRATPITPQNEQLPYNDEEKDDAGKMRKIMRDYVLEFFVLLTSELESETAIPYIFSTRRSSLQAGKKLATQMYVKNYAANKVPPAVMCKIMAKKESNDQGTYAVVDVAPAGATKKEWIIKAFEWFQKVQSGVTKVDESSYERDASEVTDVTTGGPVNF